MLHLWSHEGVARGPSTNQWEEAPAVAEPVEGSRVEREEDESSSAFEDLHAPLLRAGGSLRQRSLAARLRRLSRLSLSAGSSADCSAPEKHARNCEAAVARPPTKGILRRQKVHCCSSSGHRGTTSFGTESSDRSPGRFCKRALGRVFGLASVVDEAVPREPKIVSIAEPFYKSPRRGGDGWRHPCATNRPRKPPLVFGGTFPIDEPVGLRGDAPFRSVATFPVDAFCCAAPNLCEGHAQHQPADSSLRTSRQAGAAAVTSTSESEPESRVLSFSKVPQAGPLRLHKHGQLPPGSSGETKTVAFLTQPKWKGSSFLHFLSGDSKVHKS
ncbi:uncharacterized protein LOC144111911 [Amblyomma americanum]